MVVSFGTVSARRVIDKSSLSLDPQAAAPRDTPAPASFVVSPSPEQQLFPKPGDPQWPPQRAFAAVALDNLLDSVVDVGRHLRRMNAEVGDVPAQQERLVPGRWRCGGCRAVGRQEAHPGRMVLPNKGNLCVARCVSVRCERPRGQGSEAGQLESLRASRSPLLPL